MSQDSEVGDGTTSVVLLAGEMLKQVKPFVEDGLHPQTIARGVRKAVGLISKRLAEVAVDMPPDQRRRRLEILSGTALNSKLIANYKDLFAPMVVDAVIALDPLLLDLKLVGVKKVPGGSVTDSFFVQGVAFKKTFSYRAGVLVLPRGAARRRPPRHRADATTGTTSRRWRRTSTPSSRRSSRDKTPSHERARAPRHDANRTGTPASSR